MYPFWTVVKIRSHACDTILRVRDVTRQWIEKYRRSRIWKRKEINWQNLVRSLN